MAIGNGTIVMQDAERLETGVDRLLCIVDKHQEIRLSDAARDLNIPSHIVEQWTEALLDADLIQARVTLSDTILVSKTAAPQESKLLGMFKSVFPFSKSSLTERALRGQLREVRDRTRELEQRIAELKSFTKLKLDVEEQHRSLEAQRQVFLREREKHARERFDLATLRQVLEEDVQALAQDREALSAQHASLERARRLVTERERAVADRERELEQTIGRIAALCAARQ